MWLIPIVILYVIWDQRRRRHARWRAMWLGRLRRVKHLDTMTRQWSHVGEN